MTATYRKSGVGSSRNSDAKSYNDALKGYMCELEKRYGRIPLSPDNARIPLSLGGCQSLLGMYFHHSPRPQSRWSNSSPVSSAIASAVHLSSYDNFNGNNSFGNGSFSSHCSLHSYMEGSDRFTQRCAMEDSVPTPPLASSSRRMTDMNDEEVDGFHVGRVRLRGELREVHQVRKHLRKTTHR